MEPIQMATLEELVKELFDRHEAVLLVTISKDKVAGSSKGSIRTAYRGGTVTAIGLCQVANDTLREEICDADEDDE